MAGHEECKGERTVTVMVNADGVPHYEEEYVVETIESLKSDLARATEERDKLWRDSIIRIGKFTKLREVVRGAVKVVGLLNSMVEGREDHSEQSRKAVSDFFELV